MADVLKFLADPIVWYIVALVLFLVLFFTKLLKPILGILDVEIGKIRSELDRALKLRVEAEAILTDYRNRQQAITQQTDAILAHATEETVRLRAAAAAELKVTLQRREQQALDRIRLAEVEATNTVQSAIVAQALAAARQELAAKTDAAFADRLLAQAMAEAPALALGAMKVA